MKSNIYIPKKIKVGYQERNDTYTKRLAYVIYYDEKGKLRKEASWSSWCQTEPTYKREWTDKGYVTTTEIVRDALPVHDYQNEPLEGFVLNKKVGGYKSSWNFRNAYCRVYDPRGFEFEITVENLLYILENTSSIKGKGLEGKFVYGWHGKDLVLLPEAAPEYQENIKYSKKLATKISARDLVKGRIYLNKKQERVVFLGKYIEYETKSYYSKKPQGTALGKKFWFIDANSKSESGISTYSSCPHLIEDTGEMWQHYAACMDALEHSNMRYPIDNTKYEKNPADETVKIFNCYNDYFYTQKEHSIIRYCIDTSYYYNKKIKLRYMAVIIDDFLENNLPLISLPVTEFNTVKEVFEMYPSFKIKQFLTNGKEYKRYLDFTAETANS